jgi:hypothetical protein
MRGGASGAWMASARTGGRQDGGRWYQPDGSQGYQGYQGGYQDQRFPEQRFPEPQQRDNWGPPPPWWLEEQKRKKKADAAKNRGSGQGQGHGPRAGGAEGASSGAGGSGGQLGKAMAQTASGAAPAPKSKGKGKPGDGPSLLSSGECFKCGRGGHFQADCTYDPLCVLCSLEGHISANCPTRGRPMFVQTFGNAIAGGGFFNIEVEPLQPREVIRLKRIYNF